MKKFLLLSALVASMASVAGETTGEFKLETEHKMKHYADNGGNPSKFEDMLRLSGHTLKASGDLNIAGSGLHLGGDMKFEREEDKAVGKKLEVKDINAYVKYELPIKVEGLSSYLKGQLGFADLLKATPLLKTTGEANIEYKLKDITFGFNTKTEAKMEVTTTAAFDPAFDSTHKFEIKGKAGAAEDIIVKAEVEHDYKFDAATPPKFDPNVKLHVELGGAVKAAEDTKVSMNNKFDFIANENDVTPYDKKIEKFKVLGDMEHFGKFKDVANKFDITAVWTKGNVELKGVTFLGLQSVEAQIANIKLGFGLDSEVKYKIENATIGLTALLGGKYEKALAVAPANGLNGKFKVGVYGEYKGKVNDMLTMTPRLDLKTEMDGVKVGVLGKVTFEVVPKLSVEYKPVDKLTLKTSVETPVKFGDTTAAFKYKETEMKATLGMEYKF